MSFLYPRTIAVHRSNTQTAVGALNYSGETETDEKVITSGLPASIQHRSGKGLRGGLPADAPNKAEWFIFIPAANAGIGLISERDIIVDELGKRYMISAAYWNVLGYRLYAELLQT